MKTSMIAASAMLAAIAVPMLAKAGPDFFRALP